MLRLASGGLAALALLSAPEETRSVPRSEIVEAMRGCQGYDLKATANAARLQADVLLRLVRAAQARDPWGPPLFIDHAAWLAAYLERTELTFDQTPAFARLAYVHDQDREIDYRPDRVLREVGTGARPAVAANVRIFWARLPGRPDEYSYEDDRALPRLRITNDREMSYRLLDFGDMVVYGEVRGLRGRPTSGVLGALFDLVGEVSVVESRMAIAGDGVQISRGRGRKVGVVMWATVTVYPDGRVEKGVPPNRPDLEALEARLERPVPLDFVPLPPPSR